MLRRKDVSSEAIAQTVSRETEICGYQAGSCPLPQGDCFT
ncbi:hypothetical protein OCAR_4371 [Afipia carboxidovorans OM5]|nr:hypothetical protein OCAR_4371 [Afipia carboxidovorans OM5]